MKQEDKAKAYDEAIRRAKEQYDKYSNPVLLEYIFPELKEKELEDEKIKKAIVHFISHTPTVPKGIIGKETMLTWLKKQGEQKPFDYENANIQQKDFAPQEDIPRYSIGDVLCDKSCTTLNKEAQPNFKITDIRNGMYICDSCSFPISQQDEYELVAKRIEQKPVWSEEDERMCQCLIQDQEETLDEVRNDKYGHSEIISDLKETYRERIDWLESLKQRIGG